MCTAYVYPSAILRDGGVTNYKQINEESVHSYRKKTIRQGSKVSNEWPENKSLFIIYGGKRQKRKCIYVCFFLVILKHLIKQLEFMIKLAIHIGNQRLNTNSKHKRCDVMVSSILIH